MFNAIFSLSDAKKIFFCDFGIGDEHKPYVCLKAHVASPSYMRDINYTNPYKWLWNC